MAVWNDLLDDVMPEIAGSPPLAMVTYQIKRVVTFFIENARLIYRLTTSLNWPAGSGARTLDNTTFGAGLVATEEKVVSIEKAWWLGVELHARTVDELAEEYGGNWPLLTGTPMYYTQTSPDSIRLVPEPAVTATALRLAVFVAPAENAVGFSDRILADHRDIIGMGVKAKLMYMPGKPWTDLVTADSYWRQFMSRVSSEKIKALRQTKKAKLETKPFPF